MTGFPSGPEIDRPIFIVGAGRSGTTLLRGILSAHREIAVTPETHFMEFAAKHDLLRGGRIPDFETFWREYTATMRFADLGVDPDRCRQLVEQQGEATAPSVFRAALWAYGERAGKRRIGEKTPGHLAFLGTLFEWFPGSRVLLIERDPRAVVASKLKSPWARRRVAGGSGRMSLIRNARRFRVAFHAEEWVRAYQHRAARWRNDPRVFPLTYERLAQTPEVTVRAVCEFLQEPFDPAMVCGSNEAAMPAAQVGDAELEQWRRDHHAQAAEPVNTASLTKWRRDLTPNEVALVEGWCTRRMREAGYPFTTILRARATARVAAFGLLVAGRLEETLLPLASQASRSLPGSRTAP